MTTTRPTTTPTSSTPLAPDHRLGALAAVTGGVVMLASFLVVPGPDVADVHSAGWVPGHLLSAIGYLLLALGVPALAGSFGRRLGVAGLVGYAAVFVRCVLSTGSHLYSLWTLPLLAAHPELHSQVVPGGRLASIYSGHSDVIDVALGVGMLGLAFVLVRCGRGSRVPAAVMALAAAAQVLGSVFGVLLLPVVVLWLGARLLRRGDVTVPLRTPRASTGAPAPADVA